FLDVGAGEQIGTRVLEGLRHLAGAVAVRIRLDDRDRRRRMCRLLAGEVGDDVTEVGLERAEIHTRDGRTDHRRRSYTPSSTPGADGKVLEPGELADECELDDASRAVALFADDQLGHSLVLGGR